MRSHNQQVRKINPLEDIFLENKFTGELLPSGEAIRKFYETHDAMDDWQSEWRETDITTGEVLPHPLWENVVQV